MPIETIVLATRNPGKVIQYRQALESLGINVLGLTELGIKGKPTESGDTAEANAAIKGLFYSALTPYPVLTEDESLLVDFLPIELQPGVRVRRINGEDEVTDDQLFQYWKEIVSRTPPSLRTGRWHIAYCLATGGQILGQTARDVEVKFFYPPSSVRIPGWPLSSIQGSTGKPSSERTPEEIQQRIQEDGLLIRQIIQKLVS
ncbi:MAG: non-canonical purine NTP pyrophosphatase [Candidatus Shapirobacteria bacterium]